MAPRVVVCVVSLQIKFESTIRGQGSGFRVWGLGLGLRQKTKKISFHQLSFDGSLLLTGTNDERLRLCLTIRHTVYIKIKTRIFLVNRELCGAIIMTQCISTS